MENRINKKITVKTMIAMTMTYEIMFIDIEQLLGIINKQKQMKWIWDRLMNKPHTQYLT